MKNTIFTEKTCTDWSLLPRQRMLHPQFFFANRHTNHEIHESFLSKVSRYMVDRRCVSTREISPVTMVMATKLCSVCNRKYRVCRVCYSCTIWLLNGYGYCTIRGLLKYFRGRSPRMVQAIPIKKPWYSCLVSATLIVRLLLINGLHCCLATSCTI